MKYDVWFVPTPKGRRAFSWEARKLNATPLDKDSADEMRYLKEADAKTADQAEYSRYVIQPQALTDDDMRAVEAVPVEAYVSRERLAEFESLIRAGYPTSAILSAIREAIYAVQQQIQIPPTSRD